MTPERFRAILDGLQQAARVWCGAGGAVPEAELLDALRTVERADSLGPILFPSEWIGAAQDQRLVRQRKLLVASIAFRAALLELYPDLGVWLERLGAPAPGCTRCGLEESVHGHGETGREDSHPFERGGGA